MILFKYTNYCISYLCVRFLFVLTIIFICSGSYSETYSNAHLECRTAFTVQRRPVKNSSSQADNISSEQGSQYLKEFHFTGRAETEHSQLQRQGYHPSLYKGIDEVHKLTALGKELRAKKINRFKTHIVNFAEQIDSVILYIEAGILESKTSAATTEKRLKVLKQFKKEAQWRKAQKKVTHFWWFTFNWRLSYLLMSFDSNMIPDTAWTTHQGVLDFLKQKRTPHVGTLRRMVFHSNPLLIPTTSALGIMSLNRASASGMAPIELKWDTDNPFRHFAHDVNHALKGFGKNADWKSTFYREFMEAIQSLTAKERIMVELVYFWRFHEKPRIKTAEDLVNPQQMADFRSVFYFEDTRNFLFEISVYPYEFTYYRHSSVFHTKKESFVQQSLKLFTDIAGPIIARENIIIE